jgi:manganese efflux pump family protein
MDIAALATWITTAAAGLYLLAIWLIEYDKDFQKAAATRLPPLVLVCHVLCAAGGLVVWGAYLIFRTHGLAWTAVVALVLAATFGTTMAVRWISVYRAARALRQAEAGNGAAGRPALGPTWPGARQSAADSPTTAQARPIASLQTADIGPPERHFPLPVVIGHGVFAVTTLTLVLLTALGVAQ